MFNRFQKRKPTPVSTLPLEQSVDSTYASLQSQMDMLDKMTRIFGNSQDPVIKFQINQLRNQLQDDIKRLAFTGTDLHHIQEIVGADIVKAHILNARKSIDEDKQGKQPIFDMINDQQFADSEQRLRYQSLLNNPLIKQAVDEYIQTEKFQDPRRVELQKMYMARGMPYQQAYNKSAQNIQIDRGQVIEDQLTSLLARIPKHMAEPILQQEEDKKQEEEDKLEMRRDELRENIRELEQQQKEAKLEQRIAKKEAKRKRQDRRAKQQLQFAVPEEEEEEEEEQPLREEQEKEKPAREEEEEQKIDPKSKAAVQKYINEQITLGRPGRQKAGPLEEAGEQPKQLMFSTSTELITWLGDNIQQQNVIADLAIALKQQNANIKVKGDYLQIAKNIVQNYKKNYNIK